LPARRPIDPQEDKETISSSKDPLFSELPTATDTFYGRGDELLAIANALDPRTPGQKGVVVRGIGGSGKTQLALRYIKHYQQLYTAVIWINASTVEHTIQSFAETADMVSSNWPFRDLPLTYLGSRNWRKVIARICSTRYTRWLLVIDGIDDLNQDNFKQYIPSCQFGSIIVTTTQSRAPEVFQLPQLDVDCLDLDSGRELLLARTFGSISDADISEDGEILRLIR
jgi:NB-ARC domain